ncbi:MAG: hypothetical protein LBM98_01865 [Oscillospiraceae bacterium]|jgi:hypothetical protein|nr:hypothetical protein [Oscillospiraceae bacterium]
MDKKLREILTASIFIAFLGGFLILHSLITPPEVSLSERRQLATMPKLNAQTLKSAEFMDNFEDYAADSFTFRDTFRTIRAFSVLDIFRLSDKSGLYYDEKVGAGKIEKLDENSARKSAEKILKMARSLEGLNVYYSVVPDKSVYAGRDLPGFDPVKTREILAEFLSDYQYIDLTDSLSAESFYKTDLHWDQTKIGGVSAKILREMYPQSDLISAINPNIYDIINAGEFQGVYTGQLALPLAPDELTYYRGTDWIVKYANEKTLELEEGEMYDTAAFAGRDPYDIFLRGSQPFITIENPNNFDGRELYLFRDSFSSSLAPLLAVYYSKITLIDLRYIDSRVLPLLTEFKPGADALFLYSSQVLNNSSILLVS